MHQPNSLSILHALPATVQVNLCKRNGLNIVLVALLVDDKDELLVLR